MTRYLLLLLFFVMLTSRVLGLDVSLAPGLSTKNALLYVIAGVVMIESAVARNRKLESLSVIVPFILVFSYAFSTWLLIVLLLQIPTYNPFETLMSLKGALLDHILLFMVFFYGITTFRDALWLTKALTWIVTVVTAVTLLDTWDTPDLGLVVEHMSGRAAGVIGNPNDLGAMLAFFLPFSVAVFVGEKGVKRVLALLGVLATVVLLLMTTSRGAILATIAGSAFAAIYLRRFISIRTLLRAGAVTLVVGVVAVGMLVALDYSYMIESRLQESSTGGSFARSSGRTGIWNYALGQMLESPWSLITGFGWDAHSQSIGHKLALHSTYVTYLYNLGLVGVLLMLASFAGVLSIARKALNSATVEAALYLRALVFGVVVLLVAMLFNDLHVIALYAWAAIGAVLRLACAVRRKDLEPIEEMHPRYQPRLVSGPRPP